MNLAKLFSLGFALLFIQACSHPIEIVGQGDVTSASGNRNCYLEDFQAAKTNCTKNYAVLGYQETYYATPRAGWKFDHWVTYCTTATPPNYGCSFDVPAQAVQDFWGQTVPPLKAVFTPLSGTPITDTISANGKEWAQVDLFTNLSWDDINAVCPAGMCNGTLNGYDMSGWTWASSRDLQALFNKFGVVVDLDSYSSRDDMDYADAVSWRAAGWRPTITQCRYYPPTKVDICYDGVDGHLLNHDGFVAQWAEPGGGVETCNPSGPPCIEGQVPDSNGNIREWAYGFVNVVFHLYGVGLQTGNERWGPQQRSKFVGGWFYK